ncbi:hypothetical protein Nepgr_023272 [Nepenthes gracilis]|uniref:Uncharacterized protein n=1 Tax=Nepenthes gracilis TaxID=150966 RepID=A0AAD3T242_NEPGR|nr:hypothetical protein Nepgr_023272 [Nepenthes gracilis]
MHVRFVNVMISEIQCLRKENAALLSESHYVTVERDENSALEAQIGKIQSDVEEQIPQFKPDLNIYLPGCWQAETASYFIETATPEFIAVDPTLPRSPALHPLYVIPVSPDLESLSALDSVSQPSS